MSLSIRKAEQKDVLSPCGLMEELSGHAITPNQIMDRLQFVEESEFNSLFVCEEDGQVLGLLGFRIRENLEEVSKFGEVSAIVVNTNDRHKGVGRFMIKYAEKLAEEWGCIGTWLTSGFGREEAAHNFYKKLGYTINGYRFIKLLK